MSGVKQKEEIEECYLGTVNLNTRFGKTINGENNWTDLKGDHQPKENL
jgi:hypothetical protein